MNIGSKKSFDEESKHDDQIKTLRNHTEPFDSEKDSCILMSISMDKFSGKSVENVPQ